MTSGPLLSNGQKEKKKDGPTSKQKVNRKKNRKTPIGEQIPRTTPGGAKTSRETAENASQSQKNAQRQPVIPFNYSIDSLARMIGDRKRKTQKTTQT